MIIGTDHASVDGNKLVDWNKAKAAGASFAIIRGYQRLTTRDLPDPHYARDAQRARDAGLVVGSYFFPSYNPRASTPKAQVAAYKRAIAGYLPGVDLPPALDIEFPGGIDKTGMTKADCVRQSEQFVRELEDQFGVLPMIYTSYNQWYSLGLPKAPFVADCPLWIKTAYEVKDRSPVWQGPVKTPHLGTTAQDPRGYARIPDPFAQSGWFVQQFQGDALGFPGFTSTCDVNRMNVAKRGTEGPHIKWIQRRLGVNADGDFGPITDGALRAFQVAHGVMNTGMLDPATLAALCWAPRVALESYAEQDNVRPSR